MGKSDFNLDEDFYTKNDSTNGIDADNNDTNSLDNKLEKDDFDYSDIGRTEYNNVIDDSNVVYEENSNQTSEEKIKDFFNTLNTRMLVLIGFIFVIILFVVIMIASAIVKNNSLYYADVFVPKIAYVGEAIDLQVVNHVKKGKDASSSSIKFSNSNPFILEILNSELKGKDVTNVIVPVGEGKAKINVLSTFKNRTLANVSKEIVVCPSFDSDLILGKAVSVVRGSSYELDIDFGDKPCGADVTYQSSNNRIMTVSKTGVITGVGVGEAILTVSKGNHSFSVPVYITEGYIPSVNVKVEPKDVKLVAGQSLRLKVSMKPVYTTSGTFKFLSTNDDVAQVDENGIIKTFAKGEAIIKVIDYYNNTEEVKVTVFDNNSNNVAVTGIELEHDYITLVQGSSSKIRYEVKPANAFDKSLSFNSLNEDIVSVTKNGTLYAKKSGEVKIVLRTVNGISTDMRVKVIAIKNPVISASDNIGSGKWHNKNYTLRFSNSDNGVTYYYGFTKDSMNMKGNVVNVNKDEIKTYYVKACMGEACSDVVSYTSKTDVTKPQIVAVAGIETVNISEDSVYIAIKDNTSLVSKWCVALENDPSNCKWKSIKLMSRPTVTYVAHSNDTYYAFAKDGAGNISDGYSFAITNVEG